MFFFFNLFLFFIIFKELNANVTGLFYEAHQRIVFLNFTVYLFFIFFMVSLQDYTQEFHKTKGNFLAIREREDLLGSVRKDIEWVLTHIILSFLINCLWSKLELSFKKSLKIVDVIPQKETLFLTLKNAVET